jgi:RNA polymerase sigma factor (sigma-70 family)
VLLLERAQSGDSHAFAELWRRHHRSAGLVARQYTSSIDADDLVSEAYARIYQRVLAGGGPTGAFRPYLYTTIRNLASRWGGAQREVAVDELGDLVDVRTFEDATDRALDRALTARAFRTLPERWQSVLWYTEIEGMDPHEVAPLLGLTANGVAALAYRAREGLRVAWLQAHVSDVVPGGDCEWALARLGGHARRGLPRREEARLAAHLNGCARCSIVSEEVDAVGSRLAFVMLPLILGAGVGGTLLSQLTAPGVAVAASVVPAGLATATGAATATGVTVVTASGVAVGTPALVGAIALAAVIGGSVAIGVATAPTDLSQPEAAPAQVVDGDGAADAAASSGDDDPSDSLIEVVGGDPSNLATSLPVVGLVQDAVGGAIGTVTPTDAPPGQAAAPGAPVSATIDLDLSGRGTPGATVAAQIAGVVWATTTVGSNGRWSLQLDAVPQSAGGVTLTQDTHGLLSGLLGGMLTPLTLDTGRPLGIVVNLFG